ncbi:MAG: copper chaperone PCu(A)C [Pseudomonadota bacterium]
MKIFIAALCAAAALAAPALAQDYKLGALLIEGPHIFETPPTARTAAGYMVITNTGEADALLISADSPVRTTELHRTETDANGVRRMREQEDGIVIPAGQSVTFEPGGLHVMYMGLENAVQEGQDMPTTLVFESEGSIEVIFPVQKRRAGSHGHGGHSN